MVRETKEQREFRRIEEEKQAQAALEAYLASVPKRLMDATALAQAVGVSTNIKLGESGPFVHFRDESSRFDETIHYGTEEWELEYLEEKLRTLMAEQVARKERRLRADDVWKNKLTDDDRAVIKEFITSLF